MNNLLLITATISPPTGAVNLSRSDPALRLQDYLEAFIFYVDCLDRGLFNSLVFCENSGSDITELRKIAEGSPSYSKIEFLVFDGLDYPPHYGRGYGELKLIDFAMRQSTIIANAPSNLFVWKVTGRYVIRNVNNLISAPENLILFCNCKNHPIKWADMYFMGWRRGWYDLIFDGALDKVKENQGTTSAEIGFRAIVDAISVDNPVKHRFDEPPIIKGVRGYDGHRYEAGLWRYSARKLLNRVAPWIWI